MSSRTCATCKGRRGCEGSDDGKRMAKAVATHTSAALLVHRRVTYSCAARRIVRGCRLIDDLVDGDGRRREKLAALLVVAEAWGGALEIAVPEEWIGAVIGRRRRHRGVAAEADATTIARRRRQRMRRRLPRAANRRRARSA